MTILDRVYQGCGHKNKQLACACGQNWSCLDCGYREGAAGRSCQCLNLVRSELTHEQDVALTGSKVDWKQIFRIERNLQHMRETMNKHYEYRVTGCTGMGHLIFESLDDLIQAIFTEGARWGAGHYSEAVTVSYCESAARKLAFHKFTVPRRPIEPGDGEDTPS